MNGKQNRSHKKAQEKVRRQKLLRLLESDEPVWLEVNHPELANGSTAWVRTLRTESERRRAFTGRRPEHPSKLKAQEICRDTNELGRN